MKHLIVGAMLLLPSLAIAETRENPDRYISAGLDFTYAQLPDGYPGLVAYDPAGGQNLILRETHAIKDQRIVGDIRVPVNNWLTLSMHGGPWSQSAFNGKSDGYTFGGGFRIYFTGKSFDE